MAKRFITRKEILQGREEKYPLSPMLETNLSKLLDAVNKLRLLYGKPMIVNSGYRPGEYNTKAGGSPNSSHLTCEACDFRDPDGEIDSWLQANPNILVDCGLYLEHPDYTKGWCHVQTRRPPSGSRIFIPK